jgi:hypothetical protein
MLLNKPIVYQYQSPIRFIADSLEWLKHSKRFHSIRNFARKSGWPISYANDLLAGRKRLTVQRSLQFARFLQLSESETDQLILLTLKEHEDPGVQQHVVGMITRFELFREQVQI